MGGAGKNRRIEMEGKALLKRRGSLAQQLSIDPDSVGEYS